MRHERKKRIGNYRASYSRNRIVKIATKTAAAVGAQSAAFPAVVPTRVWQREKETIRAKRKERKRVREKTREEESAQVDARRKVDARQHQSLHHRARLFTHIHVRDLSTMYIQPRRNDHVRIAHCVRVRNLLSLAF